MVDTPSMSEWSEILRAVETPIIGFTVRDLCDGLKIGEHKARSLLHTWIKSGKVFCAGTRIMARIDNRLCRVPVYQIIGDPRDTAPKETSAHPRTKTARSRKR